MVVLTSSLREWLLHYNEARPETVEAMMGDLRKSEAAYRNKLAQISAEVRAKSGDRPGRKPQPKKPKTEASRTIKVTSTDLFGVWK